MSRSLFSRYTLKKRLDWTQRWCTCVCMSKCVCWYLNYRPSSTTPTTSPYSITKGNKVRVTMPTRTYIITRTNFFFVCRCCEKIKATHTSTNFRLLSRFQSRMGEQTTGLQYVLLSTCVNQQFTDENITLLAR